MNDSLSSKPQDGKSSTSTPQSPRRSLAERMRERGIEVLTPRQWVDKAVREIDAEVEAWEKAGRPPREEWAKEQRSKKE